MSLENKSGQNQHVGNYGEKSGLPDVSLQVKSQQAHALDQVGMGRIQLPLPVRVDSELWKIPSLIDVFVSLDDPQAKGIHMSRLYRILTERFAAGEITPKNLFSLLDEVKKSQDGLSDSACLRVEWQLPLLRKALLSKLTGWRQYPVVWQVEVGEERTWRLGFEILYSSTCPCSTALSEQMLQKKIGTSVANLEDFKLPATPHAQRSRASVWLEFEENSPAPTLEDLIQQAEDVLGTPVQTAVKRVDEQEFARLNAVHQMFCEDAARKLKTWLEAKEGSLAGSLRDYWVEVSHEESLHAHNAVARVTKGRKGGFKASQKM